jgi:hypothetical protein
MLQAPLTSLTQTRWQAMEYDSSTHCALGCKTAYLGDRNCDEECYNESCDFDQGDCEDQCTRAPTEHGRLDLSISAVSPASPPWRVDRREAPPAAQLTRPQNKRRAGRHDCAGEVRRTVVLGAFFKEVDHVEVRTTASPPFSSWSTPHGGRFRNVPARRTDAEGYWAVFIG